MTVMTDITPAAPPALDPVVLRGLGVMTPKMLAERVLEKPTPFVVEHLIYEQTLNLVVGDSGIGKTPLLVLLATAIASGRPFLEKAVHQGRVLYLDAEMSPFDFKLLQTTVAKFVGLDAPPEDFLVWSLYGNDAPMAKTKMEILQAQIEAIRPAVVIVDPLRVFFPQAEKKEETTGVIAFQRQLSQKFGCAWLNLHHKRKENSKATNAPDLTYDTFKWFEEAAGALALINQSDLRLGIEPCSAGADLVIGGFRRGHGPLHPLQLARVYDEDEAPIGYRLVTGVQTLKPQHQTAFSQLSSPFKFSDVRAVLATTSDSATAACVTAFKAAKIVREEGSGKKKTYHKIM